MKEIFPKDYHLQIVHDAEDTSALFPRKESANMQADVPDETEIAFFEKQIMAIHHRLIAKGYLPSLDAIRRAAEEVDGMFALGQFSADIPEFLKVRSSVREALAVPAYGERRVLAVAEVFCEMGLVTREELQQNPNAIDGATVDGATVDGATVDGATVDGATVVEPGMTPALEPEVVYTPCIETEAYSGPGYGVGDRVRVAAQTKPGHVRVPGYLLGKAGTIVQFQGMFLNPEEVAHFKATVVRLPLYLVEFDLAVVWGERCPQRCKGDKMRVEIYEPWLTCQTDADVNPARGQKNNV